MRLTWPSPQPQNLRYISPSVANEFDTCHLRAAFSRDPEFRFLKRPSEYAVAGIVAHAVYERVAKRDYHFPMDGDPASVLSELWGEEVVKAQDWLQRSWAPAVVPPPDQWPNMARARRALLRSQVSQLVHGQRPVAGKVGRAQDAWAIASDPSPGSLPWVEQRLTDDDRGIEGTPDRVEQQEDGVWVLDLKSGWDQGEPTTSQKQQLLVYAHLVEQTLGERPIKAAIDARKGRFLFRIDWVEVAAEVERLTELRADFNRRAALSKGGEWLAEPGPDNCRFCRYRPVCEASQVAIEEDWRLPLVVTGVIRSVEVVSDRVAVDLQVAYPSWMAAGNMRIVDVAWPRLPVAEDVVSVTRVHLSSDMRTLTGAWNSVTVHLLPGG